MCYFCMLGEGGANFKIQLLLREVEFGQENAIMGGGAA